MNDNNTIETKNIKNIEKRLDIALEKLAKIEGMVLGVRAAIVEWQEARKAIFGYKMKNEPDAEQMALWERLGRAESALMKL